MSKKIKHKCEKCDREFNTARGLTMHDGRMHPYVPKPTPPQNVERSLGIEKSHTLINGGRLELGDIFYRVEKLVIKKLTKTLGSNDVQVDAELLKSHWQDNKPL